MPPPAHLSHTHDAVISWLLLHPAEPLSKCAAYFHYSQAWLSTLIHSDLFQVALSARSREVHARICASIPERLGACADIALDKLSDHLAQSEDPNFILDAADRVLHRLGYAPSAGKPATTNVIQQNTFIVNAADISEARKLMSLSPPIENPPIENSPPPP